MIINTELKYIFSNVNEMLKFGEAKHSGLIVFNIALSVAFFANYEKLFSYIGQYNLILGATSFCLSIFVSFMTLFPSTQNLFRNRKKIENPNILFYGDLAQMDLETFVSELKIDFKNFSPNKLEIDLMNEILINSRITKSKFNSFKFSVLFTMLGLAVVGMPLVVKLVTA